MDQEIVAYLWKTILYNNKNKQAGGFDQGHECILYS